MKAPELLPFPRSLERKAGVFLLPAQAALFLPPDLPRDEVLLPLARRLQAAAQAGGYQLHLTTSRQPDRHFALQALPSSRAPRQPEGYALQIEPSGITLLYRETAGLRAAVATLVQLLHQFGRSLPCLSIRDYPDFPRRGVMLDISRGRVPRLSTLLNLVEDLAGLKINEFQLYTEHTFAYHGYEPVWRDWGALTGEEILLLDARCRQLGIDLVPNQNSFGHLRSWLEFKPLKPLAETDRPYEDGGGAFLRYPSTLAPNQPGTLPFLRGLYDQLLPHFSSRRFNVGCDETWDLGKGQSRQLCRRRGQGRVYLDFLKKIHKEVSSRGLQMQFWGDIILHHPELVAELPEKVIALNWGYEATHPFEKETALFARAGVPFYVCPGTSTWTTLIGRHDNALANLRSAAEAGQRHGALGYLNTDWGDGGHPQPLAVSYLPFLAGAALSWCAQSYQESLLVPVLSREIFRDKTQNLARAALALGQAHQQFAFSTPNSTPFGTVLTAPPPERRELFCRDGLKYFLSLKPKNIHAALNAVGTQLSLLKQGRPAGETAALLQQELQLAARMAAGSCEFLLWQQALAGRDTARARQRAKRGIARLIELEKEFDAYWPRRNKGTPLKCSPFLQWRLADYRRGRLPWTPPGR